MKTDAAAMEKAAEGFAWLRGGCGLGSFVPVCDAMRYLPSSDSADAWLLGAWAGYWTGEPPQALRRSRGHTWRVQMKGRERIVKIVDAYDHRDGVKEVTGPSKSRDASGQMTLAVAEHPAPYCAPDKTRDAPGEGENHRMWRKPRVYPLG